MLEYQYTLQLSASLQQFSIKKTNPLLANFRCCYCGDSRTSKTKARAYIIQQSNGKYYFYCHNCRVNQSFAKFMQFVNPSLYQQYRMEMFKQDPSKPILPDTFQKKKIHFQNIDMLKKVSTLGPTHLARRYLDDRMIPTKQHYKLYYCSNFYEFLKEIDPEKSLTLQKQDKRLIIPYTDASGVVTSITARSLTGAEPKYLVVTFDEDALSIFGLDTIDFSKVYYGFEGAFDSMFVPNSLSFGGQHYTDMFESFISPYKDNFVVVYDNEPRNKHTIKAMRKVIRDGYGIVVWPEYVQEKDVNQMVRDEGRSVAEIEQILRQNTFKGMLAEARLAAWSKI